MFELWPPCSDAHLATCIGYLMPVGFQARYALERWCAGAGQSLPCGSTKAASPSARMQLNDGEESAVPDNQKDQSRTTNHTEARPLAVRPREAAKLLGISERLLWSKTNVGEIPHVRVGKAVLYPVDLLRDWLADGARKRGGAR